MKILDIALLDLTRNLRNYFGLAFMFGVPILLTSIFFLAFGGIRSDEGFTLPQTSVIVANLDQPDPQYAQSFQQTMGSMESENPEVVASVSSMGELITSVLGSDDLGQIIALNAAADEQAAIEAVNRQEAGVAVIIPADFTNRIFTGEGQAALTLYRDPTLTIGPQIVEGILQQLVDGFNSSPITIQVVQESLSQAGAALDAAGMQSVVMQVIGTPGVGQSNPAVAVQQPSGAATSAAEEQFQLIIGSIMGGMLIFYAYFTGASTIQNILSEEEKGTLPRLFTTPTTVSRILSGKFLATTFTILVQIVVLLGFSRLVFGIHWGNPWLIALYTLATTFSAVGFGIFLISFLKTTRQAGAILGAVLPLTGMMGLIKVFAMGASFGPFMDIVPLLTPQGWSIRALMATMQGGDAGIVVTASLVLLASAAVFFLVGNLRFNRRYA